MDSIVDHILYQNEIEAGSYFGCSFSSAGDFNNDNMDDIIIGAEHYPINGAAFIFYGSVMDLPVNLLISNQTITGTEVFQAVNSITAGPNVIIENNANANFSIVNNTGYILP